MKDPLIRFLEWVERNGGPSTVAKKIGKSPQSFYNYRDRGSMPNMEIMSLLVDAYPDFDLNFIFRGIQSPDVDPVIEDLRQRLRRSEAIVDSLVSLKKTKGTINSSGRLKEIKRESAKNTINRARKSSSPYHSPGSAQIQNYANS